MLESNQIGDLFMHWYERARDLAAQLKISHEAIAEKIGRGRSTVSGWMSGDREPKLEEIEMLSKALGVSSRWLLFGDPSDYQSISTPIITNEVHVALWGAEGPTGEMVTAPSEFGIGTRAYFIEKDSGCDVAPAGTTIIVDTKIMPITKDYVLANIKGELSVFKYLEVAGKKFLGVDDQRVPLIEVNIDIDLIGVVVFLSRKIRN